MRFILAALAALIVTGCAVLTTGVIPQSEGMYTITRQGNGFWVQPLELTAAAAREADQFCTSTNKKAKIIHTKEIPAGVLGRWPESELLFRCD